MAGVGRSTIDTDETSSSHLSAALVIPSWGSQIAESLKVVHIDSFSQALSMPHTENIVVVDQTRRGMAVLSRRDAVRDLALLHGRVLIVSYSAEDPQYLRPFEEDGSVPDNIEFCGPEVSLNDLRSWYAGSPSSGFSMAHADSLFGESYLREDVPIQPTVPFEGFKRMYVSLSSDGSEILVAGAFSQNFVSLEADWFCDHVPQHLHLGPTCFSGFSAYRYLEDALVFKAPDAAVASVGFSGTVISADSPIIHCGMRGEHQSVRELWFPTMCDCGQQAVVLRSNAAGLLKQSCIQCAGSSFAAWELDAVADLAGIPVGWLTQATCYPISD